MQLAEKTGSISRGWTNPNYFCRWLMRICFPPFRKKEPHFWDKIRVGSKQESSEKIHFTKMCRKNTINGLIAQYLQPKLSCEISAQVLFEKRSHNRKNHPSSLFFKPTKSRFVLFFPIFVNLTYIANICHIFYIFFKKNSLLSTIVFVLWSKFIGFGIFFRIES